MMMPGEKFKSAQEFWDNPPVTSREMLTSQRNPLVDRKKEHLSYMDFAEVYADYVVAYEKANSKEKADA